MWFKDKQLYGDPAGARVDKEKDRIEKEEKDKNYTQTCAGVLDLLV